MARTIEAQAIISAQDRTGDTFRRIADKFKGLDQATAALAQKRIGSGLLPSLEKLAVSQRQIDKLRASWAQLNIDLARNFPTWGAHKVIGAQREWHRRTLSDLRAVRLEYDRIAGARDRAMRVPSSGAFRTAAAALGIGSGAYAANRTGRAGIDAGAQVQREAARNELAGMTPGERETARLAALEKSAQFRSLDAAQVMERIRNLRSFAGGMDRGMELLDPALRTQTLLQSIKGKDAAASELQAFIKGLDILGRNDDPGSVVRLMDSFVKALAVDSDLNMGEFAKLARYAKSGGAALSDEFLGAVAPTLMQDVGGHRLGTMLGSEISQNIGNRATREAKAFQTQAGIRNKGGFVDKDLMLSNPYEWTLKHMPRAMARMKLDPDSATDVVSFSSRLFSNQMVADLFTKMWTQRGQIERGKELYGKAQGLGAADALAQKDPFVGMESLFAQLRNFAAQVGDPAMSRAAAALDTLASSIASFTQKLAADKSLNNLVSGGAATAGVAGAGLLGATVLKWGWNKLGGVWGFGSAARAKELSGVISPSELAKHGSMWRWLASVGIPAGLAYSETIGASEDIGRRLPNYSLDMQRAGFAPSHSDFVPSSGLAPLTLDSVRSALGGSNIRAQLEGSATVNTRVTVDLAPDLRARIDSAVNASGHLRSGLSSGTTGSGGESMPETGMHP